MNFKKWGTKGTGNGQLKRVHDFDFDPIKKYLNVVDSKNNRIQKLDIKGNFIKSWRILGSGESQSILPIWIR